MANYDVKNDVTPAQQWDVSTLPAVSAMRTALNAHNSTSYSNDRLNTMTELDMIYACRVHGLAVVGLVL